MSYNSFVYDIFHNGEEEEKNISSECAVYFRPYSGYNGEYGFDWFRIGDTDRETTSFGYIANGDNSFEDIIGRHATNSYSSPFSKDDDMIKLKKASFNRMIKPFSLPMLPDPYVYHIPRLTLMKGYVAELSVEVKILGDTAPEKIELEFKDSKASKWLTLRTKTLSPSDGKYSLKIECIGEFITTQVLDVKADGKICGRLRVLANSIVLQKDIKVVFVNVETMLDGINRKKGNPKAGGTKLLLNALRQALVTVSEGVKVYPMNCTELAFKNFSENIGTVSNPIHVIKKGNVVDKDIYTYLTGKMPPEYNGYYQLFFIGDDCQTRVGTNRYHVSGYAYPNTPYCVCFQEHDFDTFGHEIFHTFGLKHTFEDKSDYGYEYAKTDNMLDYSHLKKIVRKSLFYWQCKKINGKIKR